MRKYETLFIIKPDLPEEQIQEVIDRLTQRIERTEGKVIAIDYWGHRRLAYPVRYRGEKLERGYYVLLTYCGNGKTLEEVERNIKIMDPTFRYLSVKLEEEVDPESITEVTITKRKEAEPPPPEPAPEKPEQEESAAGAETAASAETEESAETSEAQTEAPKESAEEQAAEPAETPEQASGEEKEEE